MKTYKILIICTLIAVFYVLSCSISCKIGYEAGKRDYSDSIYIQTVYQPEYNNHKVVKVRDTPIKLVYYNDTIIAIWYNEQCFISDSTQNQWY